MLARVDTSIGHPHACALQVAGWNIQSVADLFRLDDWAQARDEQIIPECGAQDIVWLTLFHEFTRHGHGSLMAALNVDAATLKRRMGHSRLETTFGYYVHEVLGADQTAAQMLDDTLRDAIARAVSPSTVAARPAEREEESA